MLFYLVLIVALFWAGLCVTEVAQGLKSYLWKFFICLFPCALFGCITADAVTGYITGEPGHLFRLKMGVDLEGGTILVYEIDVKKMPEKSDKSESMSNRLAEALKRRIDPNDLYNIVIRPVSDERVEIILPTGGAYRNEKAEKKWDALLQDLEERMKLGKGTLHVGRGRVDELADKIQEMKFNSIWAQRYADQKAWNELLNSLFDLKKGEIRGLYPEKMKPLLAKLSPGQFEPLEELLQKQLKIQKGEDVPIVELKNVVKRAVWRSLLQQIENHEGWKDFLKGKEDELYRIQADSNEQVIWFVLCKGNVINQATMTTLAPVLGTTILDGPDPNNRKYIDDFINDNYGPSLTEIRKYIKEARVTTVGEALDLTVEEVQRIKELVPRVGSLEFKMLANNFDDKDAEKDARAAIADPRNKQELEQRQKDGLPPMSPMIPGTSKLKQYEVTLSHGSRSILTYSWVELGPQERKQLGLDNAAQFQADRKQMWDEAYALRQANQAGELKLGDTPQLQGALFYSRECTNRNLPAEERQAKKYEYFVLARNPEIDPETKQPTPKISGELLERAYVSQELTPACHFIFNRFGAELFGNLTGKNIPSDEQGEKDKIKRHLAIILDGLVMSAPYISSKISDSGQISGNFTQKEVKSLVDILNSGSLPATLKPQPVSESTMGPTLGQDTIRDGLYAIAGSLLVVMAFMILYYRFAGLVASVALSFNLLLTVGFMIGVQATFTLPGLAGLVLMVGMAVDANVLIYERLREERDRGASLALAIRNGYDRALPTIIDTHMTGIFTAVVLYIVGNDQLRGFGVSLTVGLIISLFTSLYMTHVMFSFWLSQNWLRKLSMFRFLSKPNIDFMAIRNIMFVATITLAVLGVGLFVARIGEDLNIDFVGGTLYGGKLAEPISMIGLRDLLDTKNQEKQLGGVVVREIDIAKADEGTRFALKYPGETEERQITLANKIEGSTPKARADALKDRAEKLPDPAVEQIYPSFDQQPPDKSKYFNIRTTEKEPELVQAVLDRLLQANGKPLMLKTYMAVDKFADNSITITTHFRFTTEADKPEPASPGYVRTLLNRHLEQIFGKNKAPKFDLNGDGQSYDGKYKEMTFTITPETVGTFNLTGTRREEVEKAVNGTKEEFAARPQPDRLEVFDKALASETRTRAMWAIIASWGAILLYLWFRFGSWTFGLAAVLCLIHDLFFTLGAIAICHYLDNTFLGNILALQDFKIDFPAVAALLTLVGYSVNDTIVVFDRIREVRGKNPDLTAQIINDSINQTLSRTLLTSLLTWLVVIVLYVWGGPGVHLFAFVMVVGVIVGTYSSIYIASPLLLMFGEGVHEAAEQRQQASQQELETGIQRLK